LQTKTKKKATDTGRTEAQSPKSWMRGDSIQVAYTVGGLGLKYAATDYDNVAYGFDSAATPRKAQLVALSLAF